MDGERRLPPQLHLQSEASCWSRLLEPVTTSLSWFLSWANTTTTKQKCNARYKNLKTQIYKKTYSNSDHKLHFAPEQAQPPTPGQQGCIRSLCGCASAIPNLSSTNSPKQGFYDKTLLPIKGHMCHVNSIHL